MPKVFVTDEINPAYTQDILSSGAAEVVSLYSWVGVASGVGVGALVADGNYLLHSVVVGETAAGGEFMISDVLSACASAIATTSSASAVAKIDTTVRGSYLFDIFIDQGMSYRLCAANNPGIRVTYQAI